MDITEALTSLLYSRDLTRATEVSYRERLTKFIVWCREQGVDDSKALSGELAARYNRYLAGCTTQFGGPMSSKTRHGHLAMVRLFLNFCAKQGLCDASRVGGYTMPKVDQKVVLPFTRHEIDRVLLACRNRRYPTYQARDRAIVMLLLDSGIRASELCGLTLDRVAFSPSDAYIVVNGKGRKQRQIWLGKDSRLALHRYIHEFRPETRRKEVFITHIGTALVRNGLRSLCTRLGKSSRPTLHVNPHRFRHTFAYWYIATNRGDIVRLSRILGHSSVAVTEIYLRAFGSFDAGGGSLLDTLRDMR